MMMRMMMRMMMVILALEKHKDSSTAFSTNTMPKWVYFNNELELSMNSSIIRSHILPTLSKHLNICYNKPLTTADNCDKMLYGYPWIWLLPSSNMKKRSKATTKHHYQNHPGTKYSAIQTMAMKRKTMIDKDFNNIQQHLQKLGDTIIKNITQHTLVNQTDLNAMIKEANISFSQYIAAHHAQPSPPLMKSQRNITPELQRQ